MVEVTLAVSQTLILLALLFYFYKREVKKDILGQSALETFQKQFDAMEERKDALLEANFSSYLKHIANLEKMVLPKPVTAKMVQDVIARGPEEVVENQIEETGTPEIDINEENFKNIPINRDTRVIFEESDPPTQVLD